ncbi:class I SAM-dependent methyltransferase [bacterium]|nr:class I SAM-dependent methyltransferase [bacterium]
MSEVCKICGKKMRLFFSHKILNKYNIKYFKCDNCGFIQTENPYWIKEAYNRPINIYDTGVLSRNIYLSKISTIFIYLYFYKNNSDKYLDYAAGYGIFVRLMRDIGFNFFWKDIYTKNLFSEGFEFNEKCEHNIKALTCFECFEHFVNPILEIEKMLEISKNIIFSTNLTRNYYKDLSWWYYGFDHGQHISFYSLETLKFIAKKYNLNLYTNKKNFHILTNKRIKFSFLFFRLIPFYYFFVKRIIKSKTFSDMELLKK